MRVLFVAIGYPYYIAELSAGLVRADHDVRIIANDAWTDFVGSGGGDRNAEYRELLDPRVELEWVTIPDDTTLGTIGANLKSVLRIRKLARDYRPDVVHLQEASDYRVYGAIVLGGRKTPLVLTVHDAELHPGDQGNRWAFLLPRMRRRADAVIVHGRDIKRRFLELHSEARSKVHVIPHGAYMLYRKFLAADAGPSGKRVLSYGRIRRYKGIDVLIQTAPAVREKVPDAKYVIAGSGPDWPRCKALIQDPSMFELHEGLVSDSDTAKLFQEASVVVLPYIEASQSGVLAIAYAMRRPVIVTDVGSLPEVVDDGQTGLIVPSGNVEALAGAIIQLLSDPDRAREMGEKGYQRAVSGDLSWDSIAEQTGNVYQSLLKKK